MTTWHFAVPGRPVPLARPRVTARGTFTPKRSRDYKRAVTLHARATRPTGWPLDARYKVSVIARRSDRRAYDLDNVLKAALDALLGVAYDDDSQVDAIECTRESCESGCELLSVYLEVLNA